MMPVLALEPTQFVLLAGVLILCMVMMRATERKQRGQQKSPRGFASEQIARLKQKQGVKDDMAELLVELQELSRQINGQIDTKFAKLEASIRAADQRIRQLELLGAAGPPRAAQDDAPRRDAPPPEAGDAPRQAVYELADLGKDALQIARQTGRPVGEIELILAMRDRQ